LSAEANKLPTIHIVGNDGVTYVNVYRRSLSSGPNTSILAYSSNRGPQGLRRPRFSFFIFTCQTARDRWDPTLPLLEGSARPSFRRQITTDCHRLFESLIVMRSTRARTDALASEPMHRRAQWPGYRPARSDLSTAIVNKLSHHVEEIFGAKNSLYLGPLRRT
jgi:hypothetical protein